MSFCCISLPTYSYSFFFSRSPAEDAYTDTGRRLTRLERARLEALQSFGGHGLHDVMTTSKKIVSRTLEAKRAFCKLKEKEEEEEELKEEEEAVERMEGKVEEKENVQLTEEVSEIN